MNLSIIIVNWNTREHLYKCLRSIRMNPPSDQFEIIVVDNASADASAKMVQEEFQEARLVANPDNAGYAEGNNQGISLATGEYVLLLNPDVEVQPRTFDMLLSFARKHPDAAAVGCRLVGPDLVTQQSCRSFPTPLGVLFEYTKLSRIFFRSRFFGSYRMTYFDYDKEAEVDQPMGSCLLLSRKALNDVGLFDTEFPIFFNEVDWCYRAKQKGWKIYYTPDAQVMHYGGASTRQVKPQMVRESHRAMKQFYGKHYKSQLFPPVYWFIIGAISLNSFMASRLCSIGKR